LGAILVSLKMKSWEAAGLLIALSAFSDTFDGKFARRFSRTEEEKTFGVQLDSLVDAVSFGVVPVICLSSLVSIDSRLTWILWLGASFLYLLCALTRLGFYNLHHAEGSGFIGLPTTLAALVWSTLFLFHPSVALVIPLLAGLGLAMVSAVPIARPRGIAMGVYIVWFLIVAALHGVELATW